MPAFTVSMPADALAYAERRADDDGISRSAWLTRLVLTAQLADESSDAISPPRPPPAAARPVATPTPSLPVESAERVPCPRCDNPVPKHQVGKTHKFYGRLCEAI